MLATVPQHVISAGFVEVQRTTVNVSLLIFMLIGAAVTTLLMLRSRQMSHRNRLELQYRELMFGVLSNSVDDIFVMLDAEELRVEYISPNVERLLGVPAEEAEADVRALERCTVCGAG